MTPLEHEHGTVEHGLLTPSSSTTPSSIAPWGSAHRALEEARTCSCGTCPLGTPHLLSLLDGAFRAGGPLRRPAWLSPRDRTVPFVDVLGSPFMTSGVLDGAIDHTLPAVLIRTIDHTLACWPVPKKRT